jgi:hypothetical protein
MLGPPKLRCLDRSAAVSLEALVPPDHFYRHRDAKLDLAFVRGLLRDRHADLGRPSIDPAVFRRFFDRVVELCQEAGLVWARICSSARPRSPPTPRSTRWCRACAR